jgi:hypothetical protein
MLMSRPAIARTGPMRNRMYGGPLLVMAISLLRCVRVFRSIN